MPANVQDGWRTAVFRSVDSGRWQLIVLPTEKCNFRCTYCYESFKFGTMTSEVVSSVKKLIARRIDSLSKLDIQWFGGEPLLARSVIREICESVLANKPDSCEFTSGATTNGFLMNEGYLRELCALGISNFQISLDGWRSGHDRTRRRKNGGATFERIWGNLVAASRTSLSFRVTLRVHYSPSNIETVRSLLGQVSTVFGGDSRFTVFLKAIGHYGGPNDHRFAVYGAKEQREQRRELQKLVAMNAPPTSVENLAPGICYASKPNSLVIRSTGRLAKCTVALESPDNDVGELLPDGTLQFYSERLQRWFEGWESLNPAVLSCPWESMRAKPERQHVALPQL